MLPVVIHECGYPIPHSPHVTMVTLFNAPATVTVLSCPGRPIPWTSSGTIET